MGKKLAPTPGLPGPKSAAELLDLYYTDTRSRILETAAALDRLERAPGGAAALRDPRVAQLLGALDLLKEPGGDRAERFLRRLSVE